LRDDTAKIITIDPTFDLVSKYLKHECQDGDYSITGPDNDPTFYRIGGIVYPSGERVRPAIQGVKVWQQMPPRSGEEAMKTFGQQ
jgi:hypothetical protein